MTTTDTALTETQTWDNKFPHVLTSEEVQRSMFEGGYWTCNSIVAVGDYCTPTVQTGLCHCDMCHKDKPNNELGLAFDNRDAHEDDEYGFYVVCEECAPGTHESTQTLAEKFAAALEAQSSVSTTGTPTGTHPAVKKWEPKCPDGHFDFLEVGPNKGGLVMSSWRGKKGGNIAADANYCMFFTDEWEDFWEAPAKLYPGSEGQTIPSLPAEAVDPVPPMVSLKWWDYSAPEETVIKYAELASRLVAEGSIVQFGCIGGHGRTGTFLALILLKLGIVETGSDAIAFVRKEYCAEAIEGKSQEAAIHAYSERIHSDDIATNGEA